MCAFRSAASARAAFRSRARAGCVDWSMRNRPALQGFNGYSHFAIKAEQDGKLLDARVLNGPYDENPSGGPGLRPMFDGFGHGAMRQTLAGVPHFRDVDVLRPLPDRRPRLRRRPLSRRGAADGAVAVHSARGPRQLDAGRRCSRSSSPTPPTSRSTTRWPARSGNYGNNSGAHTLRAPATASRRCA